MKRIIFSGALIFMLAVRVSLGAIPETISYQGLLTKANVATVDDGNYNLVFRIYNVDALE